MTCNIMLQKNRGKKKNIQRTMMKQQVSDKAKHGTTKGYELLPNKAITK